MGSLGLVHSNLLHDFWGKGRYIKLKKQKTLFKGMIRKKKKNLNET